MQDELLKTNLTNCKKWQDEQTKIMINFRAMLTQKVQKGQAGLNGTFFNPSENKTLIKYAESNKGRESKTDSYSKGPTLFGLCCILCCNF